MVQEEVYESLGRLTEEMFLAFAKAQSAQMQDQLMRYHSIAESKISKLLRAMDGCRAGEAVLSQQRKIQIFRDDFKYMKHDINSKYKIYIRGCGKAGKSTLLNALLSLDEHVGSRMGRSPKTFIVDIYTDELSVDEAQVRLIGTDGAGELKNVTRTQATAMENEEEAAFFRSRKQCQKLIREQIAHVYLEQEREDLKTDIYKQHLLRTKIREIKWGIGRNDFFHNCILIDTPGLSQELRFTNVIEDVKNYEVDGIIWVISSETLAKQEVIDAYQKEFQEMKEIYDGKKVVAVINVYGTTSDFQYGSRIWKRVEKKARQIYCGNYGFDDLICVNAQMAYDGNVLGDQVLLEQSNISSLRKKINEMFVQRSPESCHYDNLDKIESFLDSLYREIEKYQEALEQWTAQYEDKSRKIVNQSGACKHLADEQIQRVIRRHMAEIKSRIEANLERVEHLGEEPADIRNRFINKEIVKTDLLNQDLNEAVTHSRKLIYSRFQEQQRKSILSSYKTEQFACKAFEKVNGSFTMQQHVLHTDFGIKPGSMEELGRRIVSFFGENDFTKAAQGVLRWVNRIVQPPQKRLLKSISESLKKAADSIDLSQEIRIYEEKCMETLNQSMEQACGSYEDVVKLKADMKSFLSGKPHMEWEKIDLQQLMGVS